MLSLLPWFLPPCLISYPQDDQKTALSTAALRNNVAVMKVLIAAKCNMEDKDKVRACVRCGVAQWCGTRFTSCVCR